MDIFFVSHDFLSRMHSTRLTLAANHTLWLGRERRTRRKFRVPIYSEEALCKLSCLFVNLIQSSYRYFTAVVVSKLHRVFHRLFFLRTALNGTTNMHEVVCRKLITHRR